MHPVQAAPRQRRTGKRSITGRSGRTPCRQRRGKGGDYRGFDARRQDAPRAGSAVLRRCSRTTRRIFAVSRAGKIKNHVEPSVPVDSLPVERRRAEKSDPRGAKSSGRFHYISAARNMRKKNRGRFSETRLQFCRNSVKIQTAHQVTLGENQTETERRLKNSDRR